MLILLKLESTLRNILCVLPGVNVPVVQLLVQAQEDLVFLHVHGDILGLGPGGGLEELLRQLGETVFVQVVHLRQQLAQVLKRHNNIAKLELSIIFHSP